jgi:ankyrin repeat protein
VLSNQWQTKITVLKLIDTYPTILKDVQTAHIDHTTCRTHCSLHIINSATMPKKSSKKGSKKRAPAAETTLVPHRAPNLTDLLERAAKGKPSNVQQYLSKGGSANVLVKVLVTKVFDRAQSTDVPHSTQQLELVPLLLSVAESGHSEAAASINLLLQAGAAVDATTSNSVAERTTLMLCSFSGNLISVQALLQGGADPCYQASSDGVSALHLAASAGQIEICRVLNTASSGRALELVGKREGPGATPLIAACTAEQCASVELLCALGADVNHSSVSGNTPLMVAAGSDGCDTSILQFLLKQAGIQVNQRDDNGDTAILKAVKAGNEPAVKVLLQNGADAGIVYKEGWSLVSVAVAVGHLDTLKLLIQHGADITATTDQGYTLLMQAATSNQSHVADFLITNGLSVHTVDNDTFTALHYAATSKSIGTETLDLLLAHGADVDSFNRNGTTALHLAARNGHLDRTEVLIAASADVFRYDVLGATALHSAIDSNHVTVVKLLLEHGADAVINTLQCMRWNDRAGVSAVMMCNDTAVLKLLLTAGADVHAVTSSGDTCLHIAARHGYSAPVLCLLINAGADLHAVNNRGKTAAEVAHDSGYTLIEQLLNRAAQQA